MRPSTPQLLLIGASVRAAVAAVHLYVRDKYANATDACGYCAPGGDSGCHLSARAFFLQKTCFNRGDSRSSIYNELTDGTDTVCRQDFREPCEDLDRAFDAEDVGDCRDDWTLDQCVEGEVMTKYSHWCETSASGPVGNYTVPMVNFREYFGLDACGTEDYITVLTPDDDGACIPYTYDDNGTIVDGTRRFGCAGNTFNAMRYTSKDCSGAALQDPFNGSSDTCPASSSAEYVYTNDCVSPEVYCKPLPLEIGGSGKEADIGDPNASDENGAAAMKDGTLLLLGTVPIMWFVWNRYV